MKHLYYLLLIPVLLAGCSVGRTTEARGLENEAYLQFSKGQESYSGGVTVYVDDNEPFVAKVDVINSRKVKGNVYVIKTGKRHLKVVHKGKVLLEQDVFLSSQETRVIKLP